MPIISIRMTDEEKKKIDKLAKQTALSRSKYIRLTAQGVVPRSQLDHSVVYELGKLHADIGRTGGLLKMWLSRNEDMGVHHKLDVQHLVAEITALKQQIKSAVEKL